MRRIYTSVPHPRTSSPIQLATYDGNYLSKKPHSISHNRSMVDDILSMSYYSEPSARTIGRGHLACVSFAGGRGYPRRKHLFSDEYRDIGDEIKTRSYYNNNYNRAYVDAMSLPTGFASYLLRIKPPEKNGTLTNLEKMHIIALSEERKKNAKINERLDDITKKLPKTSDAPLRETFKTSEPTKVTKSRDYYINEDKKTEDYKESISEDIGVATLQKLETQSEEMPMESQNDIEKLDIVHHPKKSVESLKSDKKKSAKKSSITKVSSFSDSTLHSTGDVKLEPLEAVSNTEIVMSMDYALENNITEPQGIVELDQTENNMIVSESARQEYNIPESIEAEPVIEKQTFPYELTVASPDTLEAIPAQLDQSSKVAETLLSQEKVLAESSMEESIPVESKDEEKESKEDNFDIAVSEDSNELEESEKNKVLSYENEKMNGAPFEIQDIIETQNQQENMDTIVDPSAKNIDLTKTNQNPVQEEKEPSEEMIETVSSTDIPEAQEESEEIMATSVHDAQDSNADNNELVMPLDTMVLEESEQKEEKKEETENTLKHSESNDINNIIEEVTDTGTSETTKENEAEPLIEEPQSPEITEVEPEKVSSNIISEVLSDVAEET